MTPLKRETRRTRGDNGAAAVEFALLFPIFMVLALGTIAAGLAFSKQINVTQAAREASRYGATLPIDTTAGGVDAWLTSLDGAATSSSGPAASPIAGYDYRCVAYVRTNTAGTIDATASKHKVNGGSIQSGMCGVAPTSSVPSAPVTDYAQVVVTRDTKFFILFANPTLTLDALSLTPFEGKQP